MGVGGRKHGAAVVQATVTGSVTEQRNNEEVTFNCSVSTPTICKHTVVWLYDGKKKISSDKNTSTLCSASLTIPSSQLNHSKFYELLKCKVTAVYDRKYELFTFSHQSSGEKTVNNTTTVFINTNESTSTEESTLATVTKSETTESVFSSNDAFPTSVTPTTTRLTKMSRTKSRGWIWWTSMFSVVLAGLIITVIVTIRLRKTKGNTREPEERAEVDPVKNVYTYITFSKNSKKKKSKPAAPVPNPVIYSTLQPFSPAESPYSTVF
ncbi:uncharacterized protein LOC119795878 [Cyprinodon tularosa]|uniref:uncharacterized protein LOC119795878 n=1 Tax=Cyprinodon tularosa TaxID=77115 RepID=UPI0018E26937|nr:uncharacterized protein LOC119795878 [Cyprinodon tularosa]